MGLEALTATRSLSRSDRITLGSWTDGLSVVDLSGEGAGLHAVW